MNEQQQKPSPIEVWLSRENMVVTCREVHEDESTEEKDVASLSLRGAQREMTGWYLRQGYEPIGRWVTEAEDGGEAIESSRRFKLKPA